MLKRTSRFFIFSLLANLLGLAEAHASFPLPPRFSANALASDYAVGQADLMLPMAGDCAHNLYFDPDIAYGSDNQGYADLGLGYRWIQNNAAILGAYLFGGYSRIDNNARLWVVNPGIEAMGRRWDARLNAYFPMGDRNINLGNFLGSQLGWQTRFFTGHSGFDGLYNISQHAGDGADIKVGYQLFPRTPLKAYLGSYFFSPSQVSNIWGGAAGLEYWIDPHVKFMASYTYDNFRHSTGALGVGVEFGGTHVHRSDPCLEERITDPVERYLSELGRGSAIPARKSYTFLGNQLLFNNIAFFSPTGTPNTGGTALSLANCTFERPCGPTDFSETGINTLNGLLPNTVMYFNGGNYTALNGAGTAPLTLNAGQSVHSRTPDYLGPASGAARSTFTGSLFLNSNNALDSIILLPAAALSDADATRVLAGASNVLINGSQIGVTSTVANPTFVNAVAMAGSGSSITIQDSVLNAVSVNGATSNGIAFGVGVGNSKVTVANSTITSISRVAASSSNGVAISNNTGNNQANIINTSISATNVAAGGTAAVRGITVGGNSTTVTIGQSQITVTANTTGAVAGLNTLSALGGGSINANNIQVNVSNAGSSIANALANTTATPVNSIAVTNSALAVSGTSALISNLIPVIQIGGSTCMVNGASVVCS